MALGGTQKENLTKNLYDEIRNDGVSNTVISDDVSGENEHLAYQFIKNQDAFVNSSEKSIEGTVRCSMGDRKLNEFVDDYVCERNVEDVNHSSDSLSSSASISDSDLTSTDSDDSLALSESESITDVTPLNSPYCDSPLPQTRHIEYKPDDKSMANACRNVDFDGSDDNCHRPEMNVLMKAIEKLELEAKCNSELGFRENLIRRRATSLSNDEAKKVDQENQRLFKRVISQQNRIRSIYSSPNQPISKNLSYRHQELVKSDGDISETPKKSTNGKLSKDTDKSHAHRKQKCLSHPSSFIYSCSHAIDKKLLIDGLCESSGKKKYTTGKKIVPCSQNTGDIFEEVSSGSAEMK